MHPVHQADGADRPKEGVALKSQAPRCCERARILRIRRKQQDPAVWKHRQHLKRELHPGHSRQLQIDQQSIGRLLARGIEGIEWIGETPGRKPLEEQNPDQGGIEMRIVVDDENEKVF